VTRSLRDRWNAAVRDGEEKGRQLARQAHQQQLSKAQRLRGMSDDEVIGSVSSSTSFGYHPRNEMEMQRRLKDSIEALTAESRRARIWAAWGSGILAALTLVLGALTIVLAMKASRVTVPLTAATRGRADRAQRLPCFRSSRAVCSHGRQISTRTYPESGVRSSSAESRCELLRSGTVW
jgi:hypothetical protein